MSILNIFKHGSCLMASLLVLSLTFTMSTAQAHERAYDGNPAFRLTSAFLEANGVDRSFGVDVEGGFGSNHPDFPGYSTDPILETIGGFKHNGILLYYTFEGLLTADDFTDDEAGEEALDTANDFSVYIFPMKDGDPFDPSPANTRQDNIFDERDGYYGHDPLGLWALKFVTWDGENVNNDDTNCIKDMAELIEDVENGNGPALDGSPVLRTVPEIERMEKKGCVKVSVTPNPAKWAICSPFKDPRGGAIVPGASLPDTLTHNVPEAYLFDHFECLQDDEDFCQTDSGVPK